MGRFFLTTALLLLWITERVAASSVINVRRIPDQSAVGQLMSGDSVVLLCTVTTHTLTSVQWLNGSTPLNANSDGTIITQPPYRLNNATWQAAMEVVVLTVHSSGWYYCKPDELGYGSIQLNVLDSADYSSVSMKYPDLNLYAAVEFNITCVSTLGTDNSHQHHVETLWQRNGIEITSQDNGFSVYSHYTNSTTVESCLKVTEPLPASSVVYSCSLVVSTLGTVIYSIKQSTPLLQIKVTPSVILTLDSIPVNGPLVDVDYTVKCTGTPSISNGSVSLKWVNSNNLPVLSGEGVVVGETEDGVNSSRVISLTFSKPVVEKYEDMYTCQGSLDLDEYPDNPSIKSTISTTLIAPVQVTSLVVSPLPSNVLDWYEGSDAALICTIETNEEAMSGLIVEWLNSYGLIGNNATVVTKLTNTLYLSTLELKSLTVQSSSIYFCRASVLGSGVKQDWHYVNVESDLPQFSVSTLSSMNILPVAGITHSLLCISKKPSNIEGQPEVQWTRSNGAELTQDSSNVVIPDLIDNGTHFLSELQLTSVRYADAGKYVCTVEYDFFGLTQPVESSDTILLEVQVPTPTVTITTRSEGFDCTVQIDSAESESLPLIVSPVWYLFDHNGNKFAVESNKNSLQVQISGPSIIKCNEAFLSSLIFENSDFQDRYNSISCEVTVSVDTSNVINSFSKSAVINIQEKIFSRPSSIRIMNKGSHWAELSWTLRDSDVSINNFHIEYWMNENEGVGTEYMESSRLVYPSVLLDKAVSEQQSYTAVMTDLVPGTDYNAQVIAQSTTSAINENRSEIIQFTTNETAPIGIPLNFSHIFLQNGAVLLTWRPPKLNERNGIITSYTVTCEPSLNGNGSVVLGTNLSLYDLVVDTEYTCSCAAVNRKGAGPAVSLFFSLISNNGLGPVSDPISSLQSWSLYVIASLGFLCLIGVITIISLAISVCYYKRKFKLYFHQICQGSPPSSPVHTLTRQFPSIGRTSNDYVETATIEDMCELTNKKLNRQSSNHPLMESTL